MGIDYTDFNNTDYVTATNLNNALDELDQVVNVPYTNKSGGTLSVGDVVVADTSNDVAVTTTTSEGSTGVVGVVTQGGANNATVYVKVVGYVAEITVDAATSRGDFLRTSTTAKKATPTSTLDEGVFGRALTADSSSVAALLFGTSMREEGRADRNLLANGNFRIAQRGTSFTAAGTSGLDKNDSESYTLDRWAIVTNGNDAFDVTRQSTSPPDNSRYYIRLEQETSAKKGGIVQILPADEAVPLQGQAVSLSFYAKATANLNDVRAAILSWTGTADAPDLTLVSAWNGSGNNPTWNTNWTAENTPANLSITTSWAKYEITDVDIDTAGTNNLAVFIFANTTSGDSSVPDRLEIAQVQLEVGSVANEFELRPLPQENINCMRYCFKIDVSAQFSGCKFTTSILQTPTISFPTMFTTPSLVHNITAFNDGGAAGANQVAAYEREGGGWLTATGGLSAVQAAEATPSRAGVKVAAVTSFNGTLGAVTSLDFGTGVKLILDAEIGT